MLHFNCRVIVTRGKGEDRRGGRKVPEKERNKKVGRRYRKINRMVGRLLNEADEHLQE